MREANEQHPSNPDNGASLAKTNLQVVRSTFAATGAGIGAILALVILTVFCPAIGSIATTAITVTGALVGAATGVAALAIRSNPTDA